MNDVSAGALAPEPEDLLERLGGWAREDDAHWAEWRRRARQSYAFTASDQWSREERARAEEADRLPTTINRIGPMVNAVAGAQIIERQEVHYAPRSVEDAGVNELLSRGAEWIRDQTNADREESDAFRDALICGLGFVETVMNYEEDPAGKIVVARIDPFEITPDCAARKPNLADARRLRRRKTLSRAEFEQWWPNATPSDETAGGAARRRGRSGRPLGDLYADERPGEDEVVVTEWQWFEYAVVHVVEDQRTGELAELSAGDYAALSQAGGEVRAVRQRRRRYFRAVTCGDQLLEYAPLPDGEFTIKAITGERDQNNGVFFGVVEAMKDPQRFANLFFSMLHHIIRTNAKGGILAETDAFADPARAEESWAKADAITWMNKGALVQGRIQVKPAPAVPREIGQLMQFSLAGIRDASGINEELLGLVSRQQAGVLEHQRKQAAYAILASYYDSLRAYRKAQGGLLLKYMQKYLPDGYLVRIAGEDGVARYAPLVKAPQTMKFDVIVDSAPAGPDARARTWALMGQMQGVIAQAGPEVWAELIDYSPFPDRVNRKLKAVFLKQAAQGAGVPATAG